MAILATFDWILMFKIGVTVLIIRFILSSLEEHYRIRKNCRDVYELVFALLNLMDIIIFLLKIFGVFFILYLFYTAW